MWTSSPHPKHPGLFPCIKTFTDSLSTSNVSGISCRVLLELTSSLWCRSHQFHPVHNKLHDGCNNVKCLLPVCCIWTLISAILFTLYREIKLTSVVFNDLCDSSTASSFLRNTTLTELYYQVYASGLTQSPFLEPIYFYFYCYCMFGIRLFAPYFLRCPTLLPSFLLRWLFLVFAQLHPYPLTTRLALPLVTKFSVNRDQPLMQCSFVWSWLFWRALLRDRIRTEFTSCLHITFSLLFTSG